VLGGAKRILVATPLANTISGQGETSAGMPAGGIAGLVKTFDKEWPDRQFRVVHVEEQTSAGDIAETLLRELASSDEAVEVVYLNGVRRLPRPARTDLPTRGKPSFALEPGNVVLVTGGARGVTPSVARQLAKRFGSRLVLAGRTEPGDPGVAGNDLPSIRREIAASGRYSTPAEIEAAASKAFAQAEVAASLASMKADGVDVEYVAVDVRDPEAMAGLFQSIYDRYGRLDGIIHAAGTIEDKLAKDKTFESFRRVYETKVLGALTIAAQLRQDVRFVAFFSSVSGVFGNRGQTDYAAANDFLDKLALYLNPRHPARIVSVAWGPWGGAGMVSPELARQYEKNGVDVIELEAGARSFLDELEFGQESDSQVILTAADLKLFA
jgi:NAD(P)-dependent dehydrogenase (short-subunit alcohol dehydrogenase family)